MKFTFLYLLLTLFGTCAFAEDLSNYYGFSSEAELRTWTHNNPNFKNQLKDAIKKGHFQRSYKSIREFMFGDLDLKRDSDGYFLVCVYCEVKFHSRSYSGIGPGKIPNNNLINVEHSWPQSRFGGSDRSYQKVDLHHLFPSTSKVNGIRGNDEFGEVDSVTKQACPAASKGSATEAGSGPVFEPPLSHKGDVARALFYFAVRYNLRLSDREEDYLRLWNLEDPVTEDEILRNELIFEYQGNRNPFIDHPEWVEDIQDF